MVRWCSTNALVIRAVAFILLCLASCSPGPVQPESEQIRTTEPAVTQKSLESQSSATHGVSSFSTPAARAREATRQQDIDPSKDGWNTELFASRAGEQLKQLGQLLMGDEPLTPTAVDALAAPGFFCSGLRPHHPEVTFSDQAITVRGSAQVESSKTYHGGTGLGEAVEPLTELLGDLSRSHFKFKIFRVTPEAEAVETIVFFEASGRMADGAIQVNATWDCRWQPAVDGDYPKLLSLRARAYEEVIVRNAEQTLFSDCTAAVLAGVPAIQQQFLHGMDYWRARLEAYLGMYFDGHHGVAIADVNGDDLPDLYLSEPGGLPNRLLLQQADGSLADVSAGSGVDLLEYTRCALFVDMDNDEDQDLIIPVEGRVLIFANDGRGRFTLRGRTAISAQTAYAISAADYDEDGDIDIYVCVYHGDGMDASNRLPVPIPYHDARTGGHNFLYRNEGDWQFREVTEEVGLNHNNDRWSYSSTWEDYDNDGDLDLYVANDFGRNNLYRNDGGTFTDVAGPAGAEDMNFGMSSSFGDYNRDGWMDLYVSNMFSSAGGRITFQPQFMPDVSSDVKASYQQMARGNTLLKNSRDGSFTDVSILANVTMGRWAWGSLFADINNDGWEDLIVANGFVTGEIQDDL